MSRFNQLKVKDLIKQLQKLDSNTPICILKDNSGWEWNKIPIVAKEDERGDVVKYAIDARK